MNSHLLCLLWSPSAYGHLARKKLPEISTYCPSHFLVMVWVASRLLATALAWCFLLCSDNHQIDRLQWYVYILSSSWLPIYFPNCGLWWYHKQLPFSLFQNMWYDTASRKAQNLLCRCKSFQKIYILNSYRTERGKKGLEMGPWYVEQKTVTNHLKKINLYLVSFI